MQSRSDGSNNLALRSHQNQVCATLIVDESFERECCPWQKINYVNNLIQKLMFYFNDEMNIVNLNEDTNSFDFINIGGDRDVADAGAVASTDPEWKMDTKTVAVRVKSEESRAENAASGRSSSLTTGHTTVGRSQSPSTLSQNLRKVEDNRLLTRQRKTTVETRTTHTE